MDLGKVLKKQKAYFNSNITKSYDFRFAMLSKLEAFMQDEQAAIEEALFKDLHKSAFERYATEVGFCLRTVREAKKNLKKWMKVRKEKTPFTQIGSKSYSMYEPKGSVLIIGPFNYPFQLLIDPLIGAIAAGNTVILKPSEHTPHTEKLLAEKLNALFEPDYLHVTTGGKETVEALLELSFDHIFFTGSTTVGRIVYQAAAKHLTPVTLELGGKSPTIIEKTAKLDLAARRIVYGKYLNAGQTCIAPDYIYVDASVQRDFERELQKVLDDFYPESSDHLGHIVSQKHFERLEKLVDPDKVIYQYETKAPLKMSPTVMSGVTWNDAVMGEEIFGPILPILTFNILTDAIQRIKAHPKPLALYVFSKNKKWAEDLCIKHRFGQAAVNDTIMMIAESNLPFGGVGESGHGVYHAKYGFDTFSREKPILYRATWLDIPLRYAPFKNKLGALKRLLTLNRWLS